MNKTGKSLALFPEDELPPVEPRSPGVEPRSPGVESHSSKPAYVEVHDQDVGTPVRLARAVQPTLEEQTAARPVSERAQLWLALTFFAFPLEVLCRDTELKKATVVVAEQGGRTCVVACDQKAYDQGVRAGMALAAAYAFVHELDVLAQYEAQEQATLERLGTWAKKFTPLVSLCPQGALLLEVHGSLMLFGGIEGLMQSVQHDLRALDFVHVHAVAPTPTAALWLSQHEQGLALDDESLKSQLGQLPIAVTAWPERVLSRLQGMGVRTLRDCLRLPRDGFARRIGKQHLKELDQALGLAPDPRINYQPPDKFVAKRELLFALESVNMIMRGLDKLLVELCSFLRGRQSGIQALRVTLYHPHTTASVLTMGAASACRDHARLSSLMHEKIEQLTLPEGVIAISMVSGRLYPLSGFDGQLFNDSAHSDVPWPELVEKLRARLGAHAVSGLCLVPEHRPEQAWKYTEPGTQSAMPVPGLRPLWLLAHPHRMPNRDGLPYWHGSLTVLHGPERIESGWWDGQDAARDYFVVSNPYQLVLWIYCERTSSSTDASASSVVNDATVKGSATSNASAGNTWICDEHIESESAKHETAKTTVTAHDAERPYSAPTLEEVDAVREALTEMSPGVQLLVAADVRWYVHGVFA
ncbi:MAG: DNA polymerase Y family protein [Gammaproteobacteria bacterium]